MTERPIIFSGPMVRAILEGRKTQTRRVVKCIYEITGIGTPEEWDAGRAHPNMKPFEQWGVKSGTHLFRGDNGVFGMQCPYGIPGHRLWVRETWARALDFGYATDHVFYRASYINGGIYDDVQKWKPSIHMPRWASRITLEVTGVRVERLQEITDEDILHEGFRMDNPSIFSLGYKGAFKALWDSINGKKYPWSSNPWVFVIEFKRGK